jgi:hypothetical protein
MNKNKYSVQIKTLVIAVLMSLTMSATAAVESTDPIKLTLHDWTGQYLTTSFEEGGLQHRLCAGRLHCPVCRAGIR